MRKIFYINIIGFIADNIFYFLAGLFFIAAVIVIFMIIKNRAGKKQTSIKIAQPDIDNNVSSNNTDVLIPSVGITHSDDIIREEINMQTLKDEAVKKEDNCEQFDADGACIEVLEGKKRTGSIEIYNDVKGGFRFRIKAANNEIIAHSESYTTKAACLKGINSVAELSVSEIADLDDGEYKATIGNAKFEIYTSSDGKYRFRLRAKNMRIVFAGQGYKTKAGCKTGIAAVKTVCSDFILKDKVK